MYVFRSREEMCLKLESMLDVVLEKVARRTDLQSEESISKALENMSLEATLEGVSAISLHFDKCLSMAMHANKHAVNLQGILTLVLNVHFARIVRYFLPACFYDISLLCNVINL